MYYGFVGKAQNQATAGKSGDHVSRFVQEFVIKPETIDGY